MKLMMDSLGCDKNRVDSEEMLSCLAKAGMEFTDDPDEAEICVVNTCCFIDSAKEESIAAILENAKLKETGKLKALIVAGCMAERYRDEIKAELPEVDAMIGTGNPKEILKAVRNVLGGDFPKVNEDVSPDNGLSRPYEAEKSEAEPYPARIITTGGLYEYLKIAEGCDKNCTYCVIPKLRGHYRSVPMEKLINEAKAFAAQGVKELILIAQETTIYGVDIYGHKFLHILLKELCNIPDIKWIRLMYCYPEEIYPELIETMASEPKICHYIDMPIQHINDKILKKMNRRKFFSQESMEYSSGCIKSLQLILYLKGTENILRKSYWKMRAISIIRSIPLPSCGFYIRKLLSVVLCKPVCRGFCRSGLKVEKLALILLLIFRQTLSHMI